MIPIPLTTVVYDRGAAGAFTWQNPVSLAGRLTFYEDAIESRGGFVSLRVAFRCSAAELKEWLDAGLLRGMRSYTPRGRLRWEGALIELKATIGPIVITRSLENMANVLLVSYGTDQGGTGNTATFSSAASIAEYGTKMLQADLSTTTAVGAANWAETELAKAAWPQRAREITLDGDGGGDITVELRAVGRYTLLDWLLTANTSTTSTATNTQLGALLTAYNAVNNWLSASTADVISTGHSDTEYIDPYTSYQEKIETLLSQGNSAKQALAWGVYADGAFTVKVWAGATPSVISYYRDARDKTVRDPYGNIVEPWDILPDAMAEDVALLGMAEDAAAIATETREYIARVGLRVGASGVAVTMEPEVLSTTSPAAVAEAIQRPIGRGATDRSSRASTIGRAIKKKTRTIHQSSDNPKTPVITGGGSIDTGGGTITYPPGSGSSTGVTGSGTTGQLAKWTSSSAIGNATAGTDYAAAGHTHTPSGTGLAPIGAKYIVQESDADLTNEQSLGLLTTGIVKNTTTAGVGVLSIAVAGTDYVAPAALDELIDDRVGSLLVAGNLITLTYNDAGNTLTIAVSSLSETIDDRVAALLVAGAGIGLSYNDAGGALTISNTAGGTVGGTGTAGRIPQWATGGADLQDSTLIKTGAGLLTLSAAGAATLTIDASIRLTGSGASSGDALIYNGTAFAPTALTPAAIGAAPSDAKYIVQQASAGLSAEQALGSLASGLLKNTTTTGVLSIAVAGTDYAAAAHTHTTTDVTNFAEAVDDRVAALLVAGSGIGLSYNDAGNVLTIANTGGTVGGTGTAGRIPQWATGGADLQDSTLIKTGAGLLTLNATTTEQVQIASGGTLDLNNNVMVFPVPGSVPTGVGVNKNLVFWNSTNGVSPAANLYWDSNNGRLGINSATPAYRLELGFDSAAKPSTNTWTVVSDVRTKYPGSIVPFRDGLAALLQLRPVRFTYNGAAGTPKGGRGVGLIAQEVARVIPRWIRRSRGKLRPHDLRETELLSVNSGDFDLMVINALREIADRLTALEQ